MSFIKIIHFINYCLLRGLGEFLALLPRSLLITCGKIGGSFLYYFHRSFRKKAMSSLSVAFGKIHSEMWLKSTAKKSFQNLAITCLEFISIKQRDFKRQNAHVREDSKYYRFEGGEEILDLLQKKQGLIFFSAHQANWEIPFLAITSLFPGIAIGRPIKNKRLYRWILSVRESFGGKIITPRNALKEGTQALQEGKFVGIVGDQGFPQGNYSYPLFGTRAWTSTAPALLAYRTNSPLVVAMNQREGSTYVITSSPPLWPDLHKPMKEEIVRLMDEAMGYLERSIEKRPHEWLWQHNRWKQQSIDHVKRPFRYAFILIILPYDPTPFLPMISLFEEIYVRGFITIMAPKNSQKNPPISSKAEILFYEKESDLFMRDYRFQIVYDFYNCASLRRHFKKLGAFKVISLKYLQKLCPKEKDLSQMIFKAVCKEDAPRSLFY